MELRIYLDILRRRTITIALVTAIALLVVAVVGYVRTPVYAAKATIRIALDTGIEDFLRRVDFNDRLIRTYENILSSDLILIKVLASLHPRTATMSLEALREGRTVEMVPGTELIRITVENEDPVLARDLANAFAAALTRYAEEFYIDNQNSVSQLIEQELAGIEASLGQERAELAELQAQGAPTAELDAQQGRIRNLEIAQEVRWRQFETASLSQHLQANSITLVQPATTPNWPANAVGLTHIALTLGLGLCGGLGLALVLENLDTRIRSHQQLERLTHLPNLAVVTRGVLSANSSGQIGQNGKEKFLVETYRVASLNLERLAESQSVKTVMITSVGPSEGKTTVAINLARTLAERGKNVFLVEGDMRSPSKLDRRVGTGNGYSGLSDLLAESSPLDRVIAPTEQPTLFVISGGPVPANPVLLLASPDMDRLLGNLGSQGEFTLIDAPPVLGMADVSILAPKVDGVILVAHQDVTRHDQIDQALNQLRAAQANVLGSIFIQRGRQGRNYYA